MTLGYRFSDRGYTRTLLMHGIGGFSIIYFSMEECKFESAIQMNHISLNAPPEDDTEVDSETELTLSQNFEEIDSSEIQDLINN
jgi:hypothetical protein